MKLRNVELHLELLNKFFTWFDLKSCACAPVGIYDFFAAMVTS